MSADQRRLQPRKQPRQVRAELTRGRILAAAAHVFAERGYAAGTTNRIAERARISIGSLYQYYPNKDAILGELLIRHIEDGRAADERERRERPPGSLAEAVRGLVRASVETHHEDPQLLRVLVEQAPRSGELLAKISRYERSRVDHVRELLDESPEVQVADTQTAARLVVSTLEFTVHQLIAAPEPVAATRLEDELVAMLTRYLTGAQPPG